MGHRRRQRRLLVDYECRVAQHPGYGIGVDGSKIRLGGVDVDGKGTGIVGTRSVGAVVIGA